MTQRSFHWNGASLGDADALVTNAGTGIGFRLANSDYESLFVDRGLRMIYNGDENRGILANWLNELAVTGVATPVQVDTGSAIVYGMPYQNTAAVNVAVPSPTSDTRQDYIVLRRNWADQEIRITRIAGVEGGGVPAITQSPAPSGTGIYDVPLATLSITTGGAITVTDAREYCLFGGVPGDDAFGATQLTNSSIDWADRETRTKRYFLGGSCLQPVGAGDIYNLYTSGDSITTTAAPTWGGGANTEGWQINAAGYEGLVCKIPWEIAADAIGDGIIYTYIWWVANSALASTFYLRTRVINQWRYSYGDPGPHAVGYSSTYINETTVQHQFYRSAGATIEFTQAWNNGSYLDDYLVYWYNSAGVEDISILGIEFVYTGYV